MSSLSLPTPPDELWMLWHVGKDESDSGWIKAMDDPRSATNYLVCTSKEDAAFAAAHQNEMYAFTCIPVRVK